MIPDSGMPQPEQKHHDKLDEVEMHLFAEPDKYHLRPAKLVSLLNFFIYFISAESCL